MALDLTAAEAFLKERYESFPEVKILGFKANPFFAMIPKDSGGAGELEKVPMNYASVNARSKKFSTAQALSITNSSKYKAWSIDYENNYSLARITGKAMRAARNDVGAFMRAMNPEIESAFRSIYRDTERDLFRDGSGFIGKGDGSWTVASTTLTLQNAAEAHNFEVGMEVEAAANNTSTPRTGSATITAIDRAAGTLETDSNWSAQIASIANTDYLFCQDDYETASERGKIKGLLAWAPDTAPTSGDSFFGVDRSADTDRLAGHRYDASAGVPLDEALVNAQSIGSQNGASPNLCFLNNIYMRQLVNLLGSKKEYNSLMAQDENGPIADIAFRAIALHGDTGDINVMAHPLCPFDRAFMFDLNQLKLMSMGKYPAIFNDDGAGSVLRVYNDDSVECRIGGYPQMVTNDAGSIVNIKLA